MLEELNMNRKPIPWHTERSIGLFFTLGTRDLVGLGTAPLAVIMYPEQSQR